MVLRETLLESLVLKVMQCRYLSDRPLGLEENLKSINQSDWFPAIEGHKKYVILQLNLVYAVALLTTGKLSGDSVDQLEAKSLSLHRFFKDGLVLHCNYRFLIQLEYFVLPYTVSRKGIFKV
jgi:hypothetical protein